MNDIKILDIFQQEADCGIPSYWCVQYKKNGARCVEYNYFSTLTEAREFASNWGYED
jgi:hypothetical protein